MYAGVKTNQQMSSLCSHTVETLENVHLFCFSALLWWSARGPEHSRTEDLPSEPQLWKLQRRR